MKIKVLWENKLLTKSKIFFAVSQEKPANNQQLEATLFSLVVRATGSYPSVDEFSGFNSFHIHSYEFDSRALKP